MSFWQRRSNENANGLIREFLLKGMGMSLSNVCRQQLTSIEHAVSNRLHKIPGFESPHEVFSRLSCYPIAGVALEA